MPISNDAIADSGESSEVLYASASTRVIRDASGAGGMVWKEYLGSHAAQRLRNEKSFLGRFAGVDGVVQLAEQAHGAGVLALRDRGATTLAHVLQAGRCDTSTVLSLACQLARILAEVHGAGVIHRDINPTNILVSAAGQAVLIDFDLAVLATQELAVEPNAKIVGTLSYMAPEQTGRTGRAVDERSDLYALGATLYEIATGHTPFEQADPLQLIHDHLVREPVAPINVDARVPRGMSDIIVRLLAKAPERRYQSARGLLHDLLRLRTELEERRIGVFELGERDFGARLAAPARLCGRDAELAVLLGAFDEAMHMPRRTVLISGPLGAGKSALMNELSPVVAAAGGWFVYGKFDQYQRDESTSGGLTQALRALGRLLLTQSADQVAAQRVRILESLGRNAGLITRASPEFALLLGAHADVPEVDPRQAELQLQQAMLDLLVVIATPACPLVIVVDDLQWAGSYSLRLFERMMVDMELPGLLLVGSYRAEDVDAAHDLAPMLARWQQLAHPPSHIELGQLTLAGMSEMTQQMLRLAPERSLELAEALNALTGGSPFDTVEMVNALRDDGTLSLGESGWQWDEAKVRRFIGRGNVVDLLAARIGRLPAASRELLEFMSCLGSPVECRLLCAAAGLGDDELQARLRAPLEDGLIAADQTGSQDNVRFRHDRVQQAMLDAMDDAQRGRIQLAMARQLVSKPEFASAAALQYLACVGLLVEPEEQRRVATLFFNVALALASTATYMLAERFLAAADGLLEAIQEPPHAALRRSVDVARHSALYGLGNGDEADRLYARILAHTQDPLDLVEPTCLQIRSLNIHGRPREALEIGVRLLTQLGMRVPPPDFIDPDVEQRLDALHEWVWRESQVDFSKLEPTRDPRLMGIYKLLARSVGASFLAEDIDAETWLVLEGQRLWMKNGPADYLIGCIGNTGIVVGQRRDYRLAYDLARHIISVGESLGFEVRTAGARLAFSWGTCGWFEPLENMLEHLASDGEVFRTKGDDPSFACYFNVSRFTCLLETAPHIDICDAEAEAGLDQCRRTGNIHVAAILTINQRFVRLVRGQTDGPDTFDDAQFKERAFIARFGFLPRVYFDDMHALRALIWGDVAGLVRYAPRSHARNDGIGGFFHWAFHGSLFVAMANAWQIQRDGDVGPDTQLLIAELESCRSWIASRAADQPYNFLHMLRLVEAEQAWALGDFWKAAASFDMAVLEAETRQRPWHRALINERAGLFNLARGLAGAGRGLLAKARDHYQAWGATAKVDQMEREHAFLRAAPRSLKSKLANSAGHSIDSSKMVSSDALDLVGVLRASQALSSETSREQLTARVTEVLASLSGATSVLVLSSDEGQWRLHSSAPREPSIPLKQVAERGLLPMSAFAYAERTGEALVVDDAISDVRFARDPYFAGVAVCSLLVVPITGQGKARAMLFLENRLGRAAFNAQRLDAVMLIAGQLAVSLANAQLYESLEQRVQARTRELQETQIQLVTTARRAGMAEIANNVLHNVGNVLNSINVSASVLRGNIGNSRIEGLARAVELINQHEHDLANFIETDPRGKALWPYLNQLVGALRSEQQEALGNLDRLSRSVEHITYVVSTQQAHAGPSSILEMAGPQEVIEEALHLRDEAISRCNIAVVRRYEEAPASPLDKQRLVQILVNLIGNAAQAMENVPAHERRLTLGIGVVRGEHGERMRITVQDTGEGIAAENIEHIFAHGFTTRISGHGFGLHSSAVAATEMGGNLTVHSDGPGRGAIFTIDLPLQS